MIHLQLAHQNSRVLPFDVLDQEVIFLATALGTAALPVSSSVHHRTDAFQELIGGLPWHFVQTLEMPGGWILLQCEHEIDIFLILGDELFFTLATP